VRSELARAIDGCERASLVFDVARIASNMRELAEAARAASITPLFAMKSFACDEIFALAAEHLAGFDVASAGELARVPPAASIISIVDPTGAAIARSDVRHSSRRRPRLIVGCETVEQVAAAPAHAEIALRISASITGRDPAVGALLDGSGHRASRFGVATRQDVDALVAAAAGRPVGLHVHHGPVTPTSAERFIATGRAAIELLGKDPAFLDLGGAWHGIADLAGAFAQIRAAFGSLEILVEPGRAVARDAGFACGRVVASREVADDLRTPFGSAARSGKAGPCARVIRVVELSRVCHLRWSQPELVAPPPRADRRRKVVVLGATCYEEDVVGEWIVDPADVEARVVLRNITGYAVGWNTSFGGVPAADVILVR
jgi:diaminopimelate decarboxylase